MKHSLAFRFAVMALPLLAAACTQPSVATAPQTPPSQQPGATQDRAFLVFFQGWSADLDSEARQGLEEAADLAKRYPNVQIQVVGFADPAGSPQANVDVSRQRARAVTDALIARGVARNRIVTIARGATNFEQSGLESRRVEVSVWRPGMPTR